MKEIELTQGKVAKISDIDFERVSRHSWSYEKRVGYAQAKINGKVIRLHSFIMNAQAGEEVDHVNTGFTDYGLDCQRENLRFCTHSQNMANRKSVPNKTGYRGVTKVNDGWIASITCDGILHHIGTYDSSEIAAIAYDLKAIELFGDFATTNFSKDRQLETPKTRGQKLGKSGYKGVAQMGKKWRAEIKHNNKLEHLGMFFTPEDAACAYDKKAQEYFGEFAVTNFV